MRVILIALLTLCIRLPFLAQEPGGWDEVDFALGMRVYDLAAMQPHFPGYPVYMLVSFLAGRFIENPFLALSAVSALAAALVVFPLHRIVSAYSNGYTADAVAVLWAVAPLSLVLGTQPLSDSFGTLLSMLLVASSAYALDARLDERRRALALIMSGIWLGLLYGVRVSYLAFGAVPLFAGWIYARDTRRFSDVGLAILCTVLVSFFWSYAMAINVGSISGLWQLALAFTDGHFTDWGGTYTGGSLGERLGYWFGRQWFAAGLGTPWPGQHWLSFGIALLLVLSIGGWWRFRKGEGRQLFRLTRKTGLLFMWVIPYGLWAFFAQNADKPRHILPLLIPLLWAVAKGLLAWRKSGRVFLAALICCMLAVSLTQVYGQRQLASPMAQLANYAVMHLPASAVVYTYEEERVIRYLQPHVETVRLRTWEDFQTSVLSRRVPSESIFITDHVLEGFQRPDIRNYLREKARFEGSAWLYPTYHNIVLYEIRPEQKEAWQHLIKMNN